MGMYTEIKVDVVLKKDLPTNVVYALQVMTSEDGDYCDDLLPTHELFETTRWSILLQENSFNGVELRSETELKNYDNEIELFFDWIKPHVESCENDIMGTSLYEDWDAEKIEYKLGV